jgi:protocatechuate 3,4-dioxygenase beta subunit
MRPSVRFVSLGGPLAIGLISILLATPASRGTLASPAAQQAPSPTGFILGQVVDQATGEPVGGARVSLSTQRRDATSPSSLARTSGTRPETVLADEEGRFLFHTLPKGDYSISASAPGYLDGGFGAPRPEAPPRPLSLDEGERVGDAQIRLWKAATITGVVSDETGAPVVGLWVSLLRRVAGQRLDAVAFGSWTDDRGVYEFRGLAPGAYHVVVPSRMTTIPASVMDAGGLAAASFETSGLRSLASAQAMNPAVRIGEFYVPASNVGAWGGSNRLLSTLPWSLRPDGRLVTAPTTFHPAATSVPSATAVIVTAGIERTGVDVILRPVALAPVSGIVVGPEGTMPNHAVHLIPEFAANQLIERSFVSAVTSTDAEGAFTFPAVAPGAYVIKAWRHEQILVIGRDSLPPDTSLWSAMPVVVGDTGLTGVTVTLRPGGTINGRLVFEGAAPIPTPARLQTPLSAAFQPDWPLAFGARLATRVGSTGEFSTQGLPAGEYLPRFLNTFTTGLSGWHFESATHRGRDLTREPLVLDSQPVTDVVITFSDRRADLSGSVRNTAGGRDAEAAVVVFPADYSAWIAQGLSPIRSRSTLTSTGGSYEIQALLPGEYLAAAVDPDVLRQWPEAFSVQRIAPFATRVTIARGESRRLDLEAR